MNFIDKAISFVSPTTALKRERARAGLSLLKDFKNSGYDQSGASRQKKSMIGWNALSGSAHEDIDANLDTLRQRSRSLYMNGTLARSAINTNRTNIVGAGLKLNSRIDYKELGMTRKEAENWEKKTEKEFALWAESVWCDSLRMNNFYELQSLALIAWLMNGDAFSVIKQSESKSWMPYTLRLHLIEADRVSTPGIGYTVSFMPNYRNTVGESKNGNPIYNGVEVDKSIGAVVAYWISNQNPRSNTKGLKTNWERVEAFGELTGEPNILHLMEPERCEQYRGVPYLAPVIEALKQITRYTEAELTAAVIQAFFTAFIKYDGPKDEFSFGSAIDEDDQVDAADENSYELGAGTINMLAENEDVVFGDPSRPNSGFEGFINSMTKQIGAALEIPHELLTKSFMASYSASRAALLEAWKAFKMRRSWFANDFCQPIYELWLSEAVAIGRINAPGYFNDPLIKKSWSKAEWIGPAPGQVNPVAEVKAAQMRVEEGFSTREQETTQLTGGNWDDNIEQKLSEEEKMGKNKGVDNNEIDNNSE